MNDWSDDELMAELAEAVAEERRGDRPAARGGPGGVHLAAPSTPS